MNEQFGEKVKAIFDSISLYHTGRVQPKQV